MTQNFYSSIPSDGVAYASIFANNFSVLLAIIIGITATILVFRSAKKMGGGLFGSILNYIGIGMAFVVLGTLADVLGSWVSDFWLGVVNTVCFSIGYIFMVIGANKLLKGIMSN